VVLVGTAAADPLTYDLVTSPDSEGRTLSGYLVWDDGLAQYPSLTNADEWELSFFDGTSTITLASSDPWSAGALPGALAGSLGDATLGPGDAYWSLLDLVSIDPRIFSVTLDGLSSTSIWSVGYDQTAATGEWGGLSLRDSSPPVPEPSTLVLSGLTFAGVILWRRWMRKSESV
jgi:hypothetical protein